MEKNREDDGWSLFGGVGGRDSGGGGRLGGRGHGQWRAAGSGEGFGTVGAAPASELASELASEPGFIVPARVYQAGAPGGYQRAGAGAGGGPAGEDAEHAGTLAAGLEAIDPHVIFGLFDRDEDEEGAGPAAARSNASVG